MEPTSSQPSDAESTHVPEVVHAVPSGTSPAGRSFDAKDIEDHKLLSALSYIGILVLIPLFLARKSAFAQEHAKQGVILLIVHIVGMFVFWIPIIGQLAWLVVIVLNIIALVKCLMGEFWEIPVIGTWRNKIHLEKLQ